MPAGDYTTIWIPNELKERLDAAKSHPRQPYHEVIAEALDRAGASAGAGARL